ncbi:MAG: thioredoxin family protein [Chloroflexota bacterium]
MTQDAGGRCLGPGCQKCQLLESHAREAVALAGIEAEVRHVTDYAELAARGVLATPVLVIDGTVVSVGRVPLAGDIAAWLDQA